MFTYPKRAFFVADVSIAGGARVDLIDQDGHSPLHWAALGGNPDVCQALIENKINPNVQDYAGRTPLQCAAYGGYINCMVVLLENGADPNIQDQEVGRCPFAVYPFHASWCRHKGSFLHVM